MHLYDLGLASYAKQKHFKWMLAMLSYRFAIRLGHHIKIATPRCRVQIRQRQMHLFSRYYTSRLHHDEHLILIEVPLILYGQLLIPYPPVSLPLVSSTYQLLRDIKEMGGEDHGTIRAAVLEQMADAHLSRVDAFSTQGDSLT